MAIFKCKMCGGTLEINNETVAVCQYCGTKQTLPKLDDDRKANLYDRANHFRRNNEFDKAMGIYEQILNDDNADAETYWSLVLCRYGIEYVEDPSSHKRIPTINRSQFTSVYDDEDYKSALKYADGYQKDIYEREAAIINDIQKGILAISQKEEPFDVFICYKETDNNGRRTPDSVLATELYHELTREGYKVFFSRITLEDKLGTAYEPYIFAALNSAKVMVVLGTKPEYFNAVWVKNEWSRYLSLVKVSNGKKIIIPAYKDMDPYDLPEEFSHLQAQDMSKLGFMQDLIRGISKIVSANAPKVQVAKETVVINEGLNANINALVKRGFMALEDGEWAKADDFFEQALNQNAELAEAYLGKLMAELKVRTQENLKDCENPFDDSPNFQKAIRFGDSNLKVFLTDIITFINERKENDRLERIYKKACDLLSFEQKSSFKEAKWLFESISGYRDADALAIECEEKAEIANKNDIYKSACEVLDDSHIWSGKKRDIKAYEEAIAQFQSLNGWKDSEEKILLCQKKIEEIKVQLEQERIEQEKKRLEQERIAEQERIKAEKKKKLIKKVVIISIPIVCVIVITLVAFADSIIAYQHKVDLKNANVGDYVFLGTYEQDNNASNGKEDIEWLVLEKHNNKVLLISKYALDCQPYNTIKGGTTWDNSYIRTWLNNDFYDNTFNNNDKKSILSTTISPVEIINIYGEKTIPGKETKDNVFLLSKEEAERYFLDDDARKTKATKYVQKLGTYINDEYCCSWWLRSPGQFSNYQARLIYPIGNIDDEGYDVTEAYCCVRPAMWVDISLIK